MLKTSFTQTPEGYISKDIYPLIYILKSPKKDISYHFLEKDILGIYYPFFRGFKVYILYPFLKVQSTYLSFAAVATREKQLLSKCK
jgi:hypothetical protein